MHACSGYQDLLLALVGQALESSDEVRRGPAAADAAADDNDAVMLNAAVMGVCKGCSRGQRLMQLPHAIASWAFPH